MSSLRQGFCELAGGIAVVLSYPVRTVGVLLGLWCLTTGLQAHMHHMTELLNVTMAGGFFLLAATGAGFISLFRGAPGDPFAYLP